MTNDKANKPPVNKKNVLTFWMIVVVFALPPLAAYFMYFTGIMPSARMNNGTLIDPAKIPEMTLKTFKAQDYRIGTANGKWTLTMLVDRTCDDQCKRNIYLMRQVRISLGKDSNNAARLLIMSDNVMPETLEQFLQDYPEMPVVTGDGNNMQTLNQFFSSLASDVRNRVFIIDPRGQVMMYYEPDMEPKDLLEDLKRLILVNPNEFAGNTN